MGEGEHQHDLVREGGRERGNRGRERNRLRECDGEGDGEKVMDRETERG